MSRLANTIDRKQTRRQVRIPTLAASVALGGLLALGAGATPAFAAAHNGIGTSAGQSKVAGFDGSYSGTSYRYTNLTDPSLMMSPARLGAGGSATFSVTVTSTKFAAAWDFTNPELEIAGLRAAGNGRSRTLTGVGSLLYAQDNSSGVGYCANDQFLTSAGTFVFGHNDSCYTHHVPPYGSTETFSVTITGTNTYSDSVSVPETTLPSDNGFVCGATTCVAQYAGTLTASPTTEYYPAVYLLPGRTTTVGLTTWTFTVADASYSRTAVHP